MGTWQPQHPRLLVSRAPRDVFPDILLKMFSIHKVGSIGACEVFASLKLWSCHDALAQEHAPPLNSSAKSIKDRDQGQDRSITYLKEKQEHQHRIGPSLAQRRVNSWDSVGKVPATKEQGLETRSPEPTKPGEDTFLESQHMEAETGESLRVTGQTAQPINDLDQSMSQAQTLSQKIHQRSN